jgi:CheY-like chemotaxis protein
MGLDHVLVVDEDSASRGFIAHAVRSYGFLVIDAGNGKAALRALQGGTIVCAFISTTLPDVPGADIARSVRDLELAERPRMVAISGPITQRELDSAGFDLHVTRAVESSTLVAVLATLDER